MRLTERKLENRVNEMSALRYRDAFSIEPWKLARRGDQLPTREVGIGKMWPGLADSTGRRPPRDLELANIARLDSNADDLYFTAKAVLEAISVLPAGGPVKLRLLALLDRAMLAIDWRDPGQAVFYHSLTQARAILDQGLACEAKTSSVTVTALGHSHIDVAWLWCIRHARQKAVRTFTTVLRLMEQYPKCVFLQSQPQLYEYVKHDRPDLYAKIQRRVQEGRWEVDGAMWLEADTNLASEEALVRQILVGTRFLEQEFGRSCSVLWLPDVFGYSGALPQILKQSGIDTILTAKITWKQDNRMPHDTFRWRGIDGSEVAAHVLTIPLPNHWNDEQGWMSTYRVISAQTVVGAWQRYRDQALNQDLLLAFGYGNGGGGPTREMLEMRRLGRVPDLPRVRTAGRRIRPWSTSEAGGKAGCRNHLGRRTVFGVPSRHRDQSGVGQAHESQARARPARGAMGAVRGIDRDGCGDYGR